LTGDLARVLRANRRGSRGANRDWSSWIPSRSVVIAGRAMKGSPSLVGLQQFVQDLGVLMTSWQATTFLIGGYFTENEPTRCSPSPTG
jgi:circadian clock protein KaiC